MMEIRKIEKSECMRSIMLSIGGMSTAKHCSNSSFRPKEAEHKALSHSAVSHAEVNQAKRKSKAR